MEDLTGRVVKGYELSELIGQGGFGAVYRAHQKYIDREVAIKIILPQFANHPDFIRRFETEAQLIARLEHPHIVPLYDYWREPSGAYLVMRWLRGGNLLTNLDPQGSDISQISQAINQISEALAVAHRQGIIHRDLKPENIMLDENSNAYLTDFGIAKDLESEVRITQNNAIVGSPAYLAPEQIRGEDLTPRTDIYSMGVVLFELLTGERPFTDEMPATLIFKHLSEPVPNVAEIRDDIPESVNEVIQKATAKDPDQRFSEVVEFARAFRQAVRPLAKSVSPGAATQVTVTTSGIILPEPQNPYKGLRAFQQADAADFFGRAGLIQTILGRMQEQVDHNRFLAIVGPSGSGKSSVIKAGVIPAIRKGAIEGSDDWFIVEMIPGIDPFEELEAALLRIAVNPPESLLSQLQEDERGLVRAIKRVLPDDDTECVLFIDQFEEIYTLVEDDDKRKQFMGCLVAAAQDDRSRIRILVDAAGRFL